VTLRRNRSGRDWYHCVRRGEHIATATGLCSRNTLTRKNIFRKLEIMASYAERNTVSFPKKRNVRVSPRNCSRFLMFVLNWEIEANKMYFSYQTKVNF